MRRKIEGVLGRLHHRRGRAHEEDGHPRRAARAYLQAIAYDDSRPSWYVDAARAWEAGGAPERAIEILQDSLHLSRGRGKRLFKLAKLHMERREYVEAADAAARAVEVNPKSATWHALLAEARMKTKDLSGAAEAWGSALAIAPDRAKWNELGVLSRRLGDSDRAIRHLERAVAAQPTNVDWHMELGRARARSGDPSGAVEAFRAALDIDPDARPVDHELLDLKPWRFAARRRVARFIDEHLDEIRKGALATNRDADARPRVYVFWAQGMANAPALVRRCYDELRKTHHPDDIMFVDESLVPHVVELPEHIWDRVRTDPTKMSDVLRLALLSRYGGIWIDATCLPRTNLVALLPELLSSGFSTFHYGNGRLTSWFLAAQPGNYLISMLREAHYVYWRTFDRSIDYYVFHHMFESIVLLDERARKEWDASTLLRAGPPHALQHAMHDPYDPARFADLIDRTFVHKLTFKYPKHEVSPDSILSHLVVHGAPPALGPDAWDLDALR